MIERLQAALVAADVAGVRRELAALDGDATAQARRWLKALDFHPWEQRAPFGEDRDRVQQDQFLSVAVPVLRLLTPKQALEKLPWWLGVDPLLLSTEVLDLPASHRAEFVRRAGSLPLRSGWGRVTPRLAYCLVRDVCASDGLALPWSDLVVRGWLETCFSREWAPHGESYTIEEATERSLERVRAEGHLEALPLAFGQPRLADLAHFAAATVSLVARGDVDRATVIDLCFSALDAPGRPSDQTLMAGILRGLELRAEEVPGGLARLQQVVATCHGSVTSRLLPLAVALLASAEDVEELTSTISSRPEKKQRTDLLRALSGRDLRQRVGEDAVRVGLAILAAHSDAVVSDRARAALGRLDGTTALTSLADEAAGDPVPEPVLGLWQQRLPDPRPPNDRFHELQVFDDNAVAVVMHAARNEPRWHPLEPFYEPTALSLVVRWSWQAGTDVVRARLAQESPVETRGYDGTTLGATLPDWIDGSIDDDGPPGWWTRYWTATRQPRDRWGQWDGTWAPDFAARHVTESLKRAGRSPCLLSTPTRPNGGLDLDALVERLRESAAVGFGPLDLLQAILRLGPTNPDRVALLDGLPVVPPDTSAGTTTDVPDAVAYLRDIIAAGRLLPPLITHAQLLEEGWQADQPPRAFWLAMLPVDPAELGSDLDEISPPAARSFSCLDHRHVTPWCPDLALRQAGLWRAASARSLIDASRLHSPGPLGVALQDVLLREYAGERTRTPGDAVALTLEALARRTYPPLTAVTAAAGRLAHRRLNLSRCADAWEQIFLAGGLYPVWNVAVHTVELAITQPRRPPGLADLLRMLTRYVGEVPRDSEHRTVLPALAGLASEKGTTKAHAEARLLVAALRS